MAMVWQPGGWKEGETLPCVICGAHISPADATGVACDGSNRARFACADHALYDRRWLQAWACEAFAAQAPAALPGMNDDDRTLLGMMIEAEAESSHASFLY